jgi:hypothetical protein
VQLAQRALLGVSMWSQGKHQILHGPSHSTLTLGCYVEVIIVIFLLLFYGRAGVVGTVFIKLTQLLPGSIIASDMILTAGHCVCFFPFVLNRCTGMLFSNVIVIGARSNWWNNVRT